MTDLSRATSQQHSDATKYLDKQPAAGADPSGRKLLNEDEPPRIAATGTGSPQDRHIQPAIASEGPGQGGAANQAAQLADRKSTDMDFGVKGDRYNQMGGRASSTRRSKRDLSAVAFEAGYRRAVSNLVRRGLVDEGVELDFDHF